MSSPSRQIPVGSVFYFCQYLKWKLSCNRNLQHIFQWLRCWGDLGGQFSKSGSEQWCCWCLGVWLSQPPQFHLFVSAVLSGPAERHWLCNRLLHHLPGRRLLLLDLPQLMFCYQCWYSLLGSELHHWINHKETNPTWSQRSMLTLGLLDERCWERWIFFQSVGELGAHPALQVRWGEQCLFLSTTGTGRHSSVVCASRGPGAVGRFGYMQSLETAKDSFILVFKAQLGWLKSQLIS